MKKIKMLLCLSAYLFLANHAYTQDRKAAHKVYYDSVSKNYFRYIKDPSHIDSYTLEKLLNDRKTKHGASIEYFFKDNDGRDTLMLVSFFKSGRPAPLRLTYNSAGKGFLENFSEYTAKENIEPWRDALYRVYTKGLNDTIQLYYLRARDTIFTEDYYLGYRLSRTIRKKAVFDSLFVTTQTPGAKIFYASCTSCHNPFKDATGPKLAGVTKRHPEAWLRKWIRNPAQLLADNDPVAWSVYEQWNRTAMTCFPLSDKEMDKLIEFLKTL